MKIIARFEKGDKVRFLSHLDIQRTLQRSLRRAQIPMAYSQGFNPHPLISFATALSVGVTSSCEWFDLKLEKDMPEQEFMDRMNEALPEGFRILEVKKAEDKLKTLSTMMVAAKSLVKLSFENGYDYEKLLKAVDELMSGEIIVMKKTKSGAEKQVDIRPLILELSAMKLNDNEALLTVVGVINASGSLNIDVLMGEIKKKLGIEFSHMVHRQVIYSDDGFIMPKYEIKQ